MKRPELRAALALENGMPAFVEEGGVRHYKIDLSVKDEEGEVETALLKLDESYWDRTRELQRVGESLGSERITSFGDFDIDAVLVTRRGEQIRVRERLSDLLRRWMEETPAD